MRFEATPEEASLGSSREPFDRPALSSFKRVAESAMDCAVAHWYMVPGLKFQRFRVRLGVKSLLWRGRLPPSALTMALHRPPSPSSYLGFHFASQFLSRDSLGNYLDVSSPWLFPLALLSNYAASSATILSREAPRLRNLIAATKIRVEHEVRCEGEDVDLEDETYDTVTSLWGPGSVEHGARDIRNLWRVLRPGGTLLLSVACTGVGADYETGSRPDENSWADDRAGIYDARLLERDIFRVIGQPKRYAIYGAQTSNSNDQSIAGDEFDRPASSRGALEIGRDWRCYANLNELPGPGVIVMKFTNPVSAASADSAAFSARLT